MDGKSASGDRCNDSGQEPHKYTLGDQLASLGIRMEAQEPEGLKNLEGLLDKFGLDLRDQAIPGVSTLEELVEKLGFELVGEGSDGIRNFLDILRELQIKVDRTRPRAETLDEKMAKLGVQLKPKGDQTSNGKPSTPSDANLALAEQLMGNASGGGGVLAVALTQILAQNSQISNRESAMMQMHMDYLLEEKKEIALRDKETRMLQLREIDEMKKRNERYEEKLDKRDKEMRDLDLRNAEMRDKRYYMDREEERKREKEFHDRCHIKEQEMIVRETDRLKYIEAERKREAEDMRNQERELKAQYERKDAEMNRIREKMDQDRSEEVSRTLQDIKEREMREQQRMEDFERAREESHREYAQRTEAGIQSMMNEMRNREMDFAQRYDKMMKDSADRDAANRSAREKERQMERDAKMKAEQMKYEDMQKKREMDLKMKKEECVIS